MPSLLQTYLHLALSDNWQPHGHEGGGQDGGCVAEGAMKAGFKTVADIHDASSGSAECSRPALKGTHEVTSEITTSDDSIEVFLSLGQP